MKTLALLPALLASTLAAPSPPSKKCPANAAQPDGKLPKGSISTSALVPISQKNPNKAFPAVEQAIITPNDLCTIFNLELDSNAVQGKICNLVFDFPDNDPSLYRFEGSGKFIFTGYDINVGAVPGVTTYNNQPRSGPSPPFPPPALKPGKSYVVNAAPCGIPPNIGKVTVSGSLCSSDTTLVYKQSNEVCPLGFFVILTDDPNAAKPTPTAKSSAKPTCKPTPHH